MHADKALETTFDGALVDAMQTALEAEDPIARAVPYMLSGGTDAKSFDDLGIRCFGFAPLQAAAGAGLRRACSTAWTSGCRSTG